MIPPTALEKLEALCDSKFGESFDLDEIMGLNLISGGQLLSTKLATIQCRNINGSSSSSMSGGRIVLDNFWQSLQIPKFLVVGVYK